MGEMNDLELVVSCYDVFISFLDFYFVLRKEIRPLHCIYYP